MFSNGAAFRTYGSCVIEQIRVLVTSSQEDHLMPYDFTKKWSLVIVNEK